MLVRAAAVFVIHCVSLSALYSRAYTKEGDGRNTRTEVGVWTKWSSWTTCSANCSAGVSVRSRRCQHSYLLPIAPLLITGKDLYCFGNEKEVKICNFEDCTNGTKSWRDEECSKYDSSVHAGKRYTWEPFTHPADPCKLTCRAKGHHFYTNLADRVVDGTPCKGASSNPLAICIQGICKEVGCDGFVGSPWRGDACGVCKGDNRTCRTLTGIYTRADLSRGFHLIVVVPKGATQVNVSGLRYSSNWIALQNPVTAEYTLNGDNMKSLPGDYEAAGTIFTYETGRACPGQCLTAQGPTDQPLHLVLNTRGHNKGVMYSFNVPKDVADAISQNVTDSRSLPPEAFPLTRDTDDADVHKSDVNNHPFENNENYIEDDDYIVDGNKDDHTNSSSPKAHELKKPVSSVIVPLRDLLEPEVQQDSKEEDTVNETLTHKNSDQVGAAEEGVFKITRKEKPTFIKPFSQDVGSQSFFATHMPGDISSQTSTEDLVDLNHATSEKENENVDPVGSALTVTGETVTEKSDVISDVVKKLTSQPPQGVSSKGSPTFEPEHLHRPQSDSPELPPQPYSSMSSSSYADPRGADPKLANQQDDVVSSVSEWGRRFRPNYSQSFTFQRRRHRHHHGEKNADVDNAENSDDQRRQESPGASAYVADSQPSYSGSQLMHRQPPQRQPDQRRPSGLTGYEQQSMSVSTNTRHINYIYSSTGNTGTEAPSRGYYDRKQEEQLEKQQKLQQQQQQHQKPLSPSSADQKRALTLGQTVSRNEDGATLLLQNGRGGTAPDTNYNGNVQDNDRRRQQQQQQQEYERQRQQQDYDRQQEEYKRELLRRRQQYEQQKVSQDAEYQRRLEEHNRRLRLRQKEIEERMRLSGHYESTNNNNHNDHPHYQNSRHRHEHPSQRQQQLKVENQTHTSLSASSVDLTRHSSSSVDTRISPSYPDDTRRRPTTDPPYIWQAGTADRRTGTDVSHDRIRQQAYLEQLRQQQIEQQRQQQLQASSTFYTRGTNRRNPYAQRIENTDRNDERPAAPETPQTSSSIRKYLTSPTETGPYDKTAGRTTASSVHNLPSSVSYSIGGPAPPQFVPDDPHQDSRSSLTAASSASSDGIVSNELPDAVDSSIVVHSEKKLPSSVIEKDTTSFALQPATNEENSLLIGSGGSILPNLIESGTLISKQAEELTAATDDRMPYEWRVSGLTDCTITCGGGVQQTIVVCLDTSTQAVVTDGNCQHLTRPTSKALTCNTRPCPSEWLASEWSACSVTCGEGGIQTRILTCQARISATLNMSMPEENCRTAVRPEDRRSCDSKPCWTWNVGNWSQCSVLCGEGVLTRQVICVDSTGFDVLETLCQGSKPSKEEACNMGTCGKGWYFTDWPEQCPARCGGRMVSRHVTCLGDHDQRLPDSSCDRTLRPEDQKECRADGPCGGEWFTGEWENCNATCGNGYRERDVVCMKTLPGGLLTVVDEENCAAALKPEVLEPCRREACLAEWYMTPWSECSQPCGSGQRTRQVKCLDNLKRPISDCPLNSKPQTREPCNSDSCQTTAPVAAAPSEDCTDSFLRCDIVKRTRMCQSQYYRKKCCVTCAANNT